MFKLFCSTDVVYSRLFHFISQKPGRQANIMCIDERTHSFQYFIWIYIVYRHYSRRIHTHTHTTDVLCGFINHFHDKHTLKTHQFVYVTVWNTTAAPTLMQRIVDVLVTHTTTTHTYLWLRTNNNVRIQKTYTHRYSTFRAWWYKNMGRKLSRGEMEWNGTR